MSNFPTTILLATDGSRDAELARTTAIDLANSTNSELHVVTVAPGYPSYDVYNPEVLEQLRKQAEDILNEQAEKVKREGGQSRRETPQDSRAVPRRADRPGRRGHRSRPHRHG
jgi:nucleotide-binding universal stress UspA family protein